MALTVEDGTGLDDADALADVADVVAYLDARGMTGFGLLATAALKEAAIRNATEYLSTAFEWAGIKLSEDQALAIPTDLVAAGDDLPNSILAALSRVAFAVGVNGQNLFGTVTSQSAVQSVKAGSVAVEFSSTAIGLATSGRPDFPWLLDLLGPYIVDGGSDFNVKLVRT